MIYSSVRPGCPTVALVLGLARNWPECCADSGWPHWPSETKKAVSPLTINVDLIGRKWLQSRSNTRGKRKFERERYSSLGGKFKAETMGGSWFCVFPAKGAAGFRWWHSTSLTQQWLEAIMPGCRGDLLSVFQWKPPQIRGMPRLWNQI